MITLDEVICGRMPRVMSLHLAFIVVLLFRSRATQQAVWVVC